jgi:hypothetical protein
MAYVPEMRYEPEMGKSIFKKIGKAISGVANVVSKVTSVVPLPQTQAVNAVSGALSKVKKVGGAIKSATKGSKKTPTQITTEQTTETPEEITPSEEKIFGLDKKVVMIGGGAVGLVLLLTLIRKK